jgi:cell division protein FtsI (penicillin-binding protein 3)
MMDDLATMPSEAARRSAIVKPKRSQDLMRRRIRIAIGFFSLAYLVLVGRLVMFGMMPPVSGAGGDPNAGLGTGRPDLVDRNGEILATDIKMSSLYGEPRNIYDPDEAAEAIHGVLPDLDVDTLRKKLTGNAGFVWLKRELTPIQQDRIHALGIPGIGFLTENKRFYPGGPTASHLVGLVNVDNQGIAGIEKYVDDHWLRDLHAAGFAQGEDLQPVKLSVDVRVQHILRDELQQGITQYHAKAASGIILNVKTGEVMAMASLPDFDPNNPYNAGQPDRLNRVSAGAFELGSVFKSFTFAMAFDSGKVSMNDTEDASHPLRFGKFAIHDFHAKNRPLTVPEIFIYSSNIGSARMALQVGAEGQQEYLKRFGLLSKVQTELPEVALPIVPKRWADITTATIAFGHGLAVTPLQVAVADAALVNGGKLIPPTFMPRTEAEADKLAVQVVKPETSEKLRYLFALNTEKGKGGSGTRAAVPGYNVGGKTGTAEKVEHGHYSATKRLNSFLAAFPIDDPQFVVLVVIDEPEAEKPGMGATAGLNAAPMVGAVIRRSAALLGVKPRTKAPDGAILVSN